MEKGRTILVSHMLPLHTDEATGECVFAPPYSSLGASVVYGVPSEARAETIFVGLKTPKGMDPPRGPPPQGFVFHEVCIPQQEGELAYTSHISRLCHASLTTHALSADEMVDAYSEYVDFNNVFWEKISEIYMPGDILVVVAKDLWLLPGIVREHIPHAKVCMVVLVPFPPYEIFSCIPHAKELVTSLLSCDRVELRTEEHLLNFRNTAFSLLNAQYREVGADVFGREYGEPNREAVEKQAGEERREEGTQDLESSSAKYRNVGFDALLSQCYSSNMKLELLNLNEIAEAHKRMASAQSMESEDVEEKEVREYISDCVGDGKILEKPQDKERFFIVYHSDLRCLACTNPLGAPVGFLEDIKKSPAFKDVCEKIRRAYEGKRLVLNIETTRATEDPTMRLQAIIRYLSEHRDEAVHFIRIVLCGESSYVPSTVASGLCEKIATSFPRKFQSLIFPGLYEYVALLSLADLLLTCSNNDALSASVKEFLWVNEKKAPVIAPYSSGVSNVGVFFSLNCSFAMAGLIEKCLGLEGEERERRFAENKRSVRATSKWMEEACRMVRRQQPSSGDGAREKPRARTLRSVSRCSPLDTERVVEMCRGAKSRLILVDYDGTLTEIVPNPGDAAPTEEIRELLRMLTGDASNRLCIITGRGKKEAEQWFGELGGTIYAEHGAWRKEAGEWEETACSLEWIPDVQRVVEEFVKMTPGSHMEMKSTCVVFHCGESGRWCANALHKIVGTRARVVTGKGIVEVRPAGIDKGACVLKEIGGAEVTLCFGDDLTDEDMFMVMKGMENCFTVCVGERETCAEWKLSCPQEVRSLLKRIS